jgi:hypothetical protein
MVQELELAKAAVESIKTFRRLTNGRERLASALLLGVALEEALDQGLNEKDIVDRVYSIARDRTHDLI